MTDAVMAARLARTYYHKVSAFRPLPRGGEEQVCEDVPCALSRSALTSAPTPPDREYVLPEALYRLALYTRPEVGFQLGDRVEVTDDGGRVFRGRTSDSFRYPSHCVTVVEVAEVTSAEA
jgi:hypothetical protein